jgi:hypothetical protein
MTTIRVRIGSVAAGPSRPRRRANRGQRACHPVSGGSDRDHHHNRSWAAFVFDQPARNGSSKAEAASGPGKRDCQRPPVARRIAPQQPRPCHDQHRRWPQPPARSRAGTAGERSVAGGCAYCHGRCSCRGARRSRPSGTLRRPGFPAHLARSGLPQLGRAMRPGMLLPARLPAPVRQHLRRQRVRRSRAVRPAACSAHRQRQAGSIRPVAGRTHTKRHAGPGEIAMYRILASLAAACNDRFTTLQLPAGARRFGQGMFVQPDEDLRAGRHRAGALSVRSWCPGRTGLSNLRDSGLAVLCRSAQIGHRLPEPRRGAS